MTKCWYKHMYEMIYQSLIVRQFFFNITIELTSSWDISSESSSPSIKRNRLELRSFSFLSFLMAINRKKNNTIGWEVIFLRSLVMDMSWLNIRIYHMLCISDQTCICMAQLFTGIHWLNCKQSYQYSQIPLYQNHE